MQQLEHIEGIFHHYFLDLLLPFYFLTIQENLYVIHLYSNLFYEVHNTINQRYQKQINFLSFSFLNLFDIFAKEIKKVLQ